MPRGSKPGLRPHLWKVPGEVPHQQYIAWQRARAQANFRGELWMLTFEEYQQVWQGYWDQKGRGAMDYCLTRDDPEGAWVRDNVIVINRQEFLRRKRTYQMAQQ